MAEEKLDVSIVVGRIGWYQFAVMMLTVLRAVPTSWTLTSIDFLAGDVQHRCALPPNSRDTALWKSSDLPDVDSKLRQCYRPALGDGRVQANFSAPCDSWEYDEAPSSSLVEWNLVCDRAWMKSAMQSVVFIGQFVGALFIGYLSDAYGRKFMLVVSTAAMLFFGCLASFSPTVFVFNLLRLFQAMAVSGLQTTTATLYTEICLPQERNLLNIGFSLGFTVPTIILPFLAMAVDDWRWVQASAGLSVLLIVPCMLIVQESPRWLLTKGRLSDAKSAINRIFRVNRRPLPDLEKLMPALVAKTQADSAAKNLTVRDICSHRRLAITVFLLFVFWFFENLFYFANAFIATKLGSDRFTSFAMSAAAEIPGGLLGIVILRYCRRRLSLAIILQCAALASLMLAFSSTDMVRFRLFLNMTCRFFLVMSTAIKWVYTFELLPTPARAAGFAVCYCFGRLGGMISPFMRDLADWSAPAPHFVLAGCALIAMCTLLFTPETLNKDLPDSFDESDQLGLEPKQQQQQQHENTAT